MRQSLNEDMAAVRASILKSAEHRESIHHRAIRYVRESLAGSNRTGMQGVTLATYIHQGAEAFIDASLKPFVDAAIKQDPKASLIPRASDVVIEAVTWSVNMLIGAYIEPMLEAGLEPFTSLQDEGEDENDEDGVELTILPSTPRLSSSVTRMSYDDFLAAKASQRESETNMETTQ